GEQPDNRRVVTYADINAGAGFSNRPFLQGASSSVFGRLSLSAFRGWNSERGSTSVTGFVENTTYLRGGYGSKVLFRAAAQTTRAMSETVSVFGRLGISSDLAGQLANRFTTPVDITTPPDTIPLPESDLGIINVSGRTYRIDGQAGASITTSPVSSVSLSAGATHTFFTGRNTRADYTTYNASFGYGHKVSERTSIGASLSLQRQDFAGSDYSNVVNPAATFQTQLGENINVTGSVGLLAIYAHRNGESSHSYSPSFSAALCKSGENSRLCATASRTAQTPLTIVSSSQSFPRGTAVSTNFSLNYTRLLGEGGSLRALVNATHSSRANLLPDGQTRATYVSALVGYDRKIGNRLFGGATVGARKLFQSGTDPRPDYNGSIYIRYRIGDLL
ncbi:MAG: hypothetical protein ABI454_07355, partial [Sphingomicrobium sp.]